MERLMSVKELASHLGIAVVTIYGWCSKGRLPLVKVGRRTMFRERDIERWLDRQAKPVKLDSPKLDKGLQPCSGLSGKRGGSLGRS